MVGIMGKIRSLDVYPKINEDFYSRTFCGGVITLVSSLLMILLFISELGLYLHAVTETHLVGDKGIGETLHINFDITFPALACSIVSIDSMDISGQQHFDVKHAIIKKRIDANGNVIEIKHDTIGSPKCKREGFLQQIKNEEGEGCNIYGFLEVNKIAGNFHFSPGKSFVHDGVHRHDLLSFQKDNFNVSHKINRLAFGGYFPGVVNPLDSVHWTQNTPTSMYQYFIKVVPTVYTHVNGRTVQSNQFSVTEHSRRADVGRLQSLPGVFFFYDLSPIKVTFTEAHVPFLHFLTNVCAIVGGIFTVSGILDSFIYHGHKAIKKKMDLGKFSYEKRSSAWLLHWIWLVIF